ncbi:MAG: hypothetical protein ACLU9X_03410 [Alistipes shahii]
MEEKKSPASAAESACLPGQPAAVGRRRSNAKIRHCNGNSRPWWTDLVSAACLRLAQGLGTDRRGWTACDGLIRCCCARPDEADFKHRLEPDRAGHGRWRALYFVLDVRSRSRASSTTAGAARRQRSVARFSGAGLNPALLLWAFVLMFAVGVVLEPLLRPDARAVARTSGPRIRGPSFRW